jgi:hypothetical protein
MLHQLGDKGAEFVEKLGASKASQRINKPKS